jgi:hypothetical protein
MKSIHRNHTATGPDFLGKCRGKGGFAASGWTGNSDRKHPVDPCLRQDIGSQTVQVTAM